MDGSIILLRFFILIWLVNGVLSELFEQMAVLIGAELLHEGSILESVSYVGEGFGAVVGFQELRKHNFLSCYASDVGVKHFNGVCGLEKLGVGLRCVREPLEREFLQTSEVRYFSRQLCYFVFMQIEQGQSRQLAEFRGQTRYFVVV